MQYGKHRLEIKVTPELFAELKAAAKATGAARIIACGEAPDADARLVAMSADAEGSDVGATILGRDLRFRIGAPGAHYAQNAIAVLAAVAVVGADVAGAAAALAGISAPVGRGARGRYDLAGGPVLLIDESYNANPASMRAALAVLAAAAPEPGGRRIAVLGDMRELGEHGPALHRGLKDAVEQGQADKVFACGHLMRNLFEAIPVGRRGAWAELSTGLIVPLLAELKAGDVVMVKGSLGTNMAPIIAGLKICNTRLAAAAGKTL